MRKHKQRIGRKEGKTGKKSMRKGGNKKDIDKEQEEEWTLNMRSLYCQHLARARFRFWDRCGGFENRGE